MVRLKGVEGGGRQMVKVKQEKKKVDFHHSRGKRCLCEARVSPTWAFQGRANEGKKTFLSIIDNLYINKERGKFFFLGKLVILIY